MSHMPLTRAIQFSLLMVMTAGMFYCGKEKPPPPRAIIPFPPDSLAQYFQTRTDSSENLWLLDPKDATTAFINEYDMVKGGFSANDAILIGEGLFHATVEAELPDKILVIDLERPFKHLGDKSIWQVVSMKEKPWPKKK